MISIIVPIFNVEQYLSKCVDSVLSQSYKDMEIILVDDGSTDSCPSICDEYTKKDNRITVIHKKNGGLSDARNAGKKIARGEWIFFLDADDWIDYKTIETLYHFAIENDCDIVQGNFYYTYNEYLMYRSENSEEKSNHILNRTGAMKELIINKRVKNFAWGKLYKTNIANGFDFPVGKYFEDSYWQHLIFHQIDKYGIIDVPLYYYRQRKDSISGQLSSRYDDLIEGYRSRLEFIKVHYPQYVGIMVKQYKDICELKYPSKGVLAKLFRFYMRIYKRLFSDEQFRIRKV